MQNELTNLTVAVQVLAEKLNRIEAEVAHQRVVAIDPAVSATENAISLLEMVITTNKAQTEEYRRILADMRNKRRGR